MKQNNLKQEIELCLVVFPVMDEFSKFEIKNRENIDCAEHEFAVTDASEA